MSSRSRTTLVSFTGHLPGLAGPGYRNRPRLEWRAAAGGHTIQPRQRLRHDPMGLHVPGGLAALEAYEVRSGAHAQPLRLLGVELTGSLVLERGVAQRRHTVVAAEPG